MDNLPSFWDAVRRSKDIFSWASFINGIAFLIVAVLPFVLSEKRRVMFRNFDWKKDVGIDEIGCVIVIAISIYCIWSALKQIKNQSVQIIDTIARILILIFISELYLFSIQKFESANQQNQIEMLLEKSYLEENLPKIRKLATEMRKMADLLPQNTIRAFTNRTSDLPLDQDPNRLDISFQATTLHFDEQFEKIFGRKIESYEYDKFQYLAMEGVIGDDLCPNATCKKRFAQRQFLTREVLKKMGGHLDEAESALNAVTKKIADRRRGTHGVD